VTPIRIREAKHIIGSGPTTGLRTWEACLRLAHFLYRNQDLIQGKNVLELGAGTGFLSIFCLLVLGAKNVVATDGNEQVLDGLRENIALNRSSFVKLNCPEPITKKLYWGDDEDLDELKITLLHSNDPDAGGTQGSALIPDIILGADITYHPDANELLAPLITQLSRVMQTARNENMSSRTLPQPSTRTADPSPQILIAATERAPKTLSDFFALLNAAHPGSSTVNEPQLHEQLAFQVTEHKAFKCPVEQQKGLFHNLAMPIRIFGISLTQFY
jgi:predicted nicotinamide N-methyase